MDGKKFIIGLFIFFIVFSLLLFFTLYYNGWFDIFMKGGFKELYGD